MKKLMVAMVAVVVCAFTLSAYAGKACCPFTAKAKDAAKDKVESKVTGTECANADAKCQILSVKDGKATCCGCEKGCKKCTMKEGEAKCSCGKDVTNCDLKGKFVCTPCKTISEQAGKCACGSELTEVK
jgi:hypothetical protein